MGSTADRAGAGPDPQVNTSADEPKTETTLTTRIRINIPGSRPIPPVVMRQPVVEGDGGPWAEPDSAREAGAVNDPAAVAPTGAAMSANPGGNGGGSGAGSGTGGSGSGGSGGAGSGGSGSGGSGSGGSGSGSGGSGSGGTTQGTSDWFAPRKPVRSQPEQDGDERTDSPPPGGGQGNGRSGTPYGFPAAPSSAQDASPDDVPRTPDGFPAPHATPGAAPGAAPGAGSPRSPLSDLVDGPPGGPRGGPPGAPGAGPTTGPGTGDMAPPPPVPGAPRGADEDSPMTSTLGLGTGPAIYPQTEEDDGGVPGVPGDGRITSNTLVSGIPRVPSSNHGFPSAPSSPHLVDDVRDRGDRGDRGDREERRRRPLPAPAGGGRSKLMLAGTVLVGVLGIAYGTGLFLDHADIPKGTTVLGVDIGGKDQQTAVNTLEAALGDRDSAPLTVVANGEKTKLKPSVAGLTIDPDATVRAASGQDYNPVTVIGSLFGVSREAEPAVEVDDEKLSATLTSLSSGGSGAAKDGMVTFTGGQAKAVPGQAHKGIDVGQASVKLEDAYRTRAATGQNKPVTLPVSTQQPTIGEKELQKSVNGFGKTAMSGWVWLRAGDVEVPFSEKTIGTFLTMEAGGGKLVPVIDTAKLAESYGTAFDGVVIDGGAGTVEMTPKHAAAAMVEALKKQAPPEPEKRVAQVPDSRSE